MGLRHVSEPRRVILRTALAFIAAACVAVLLRHGLAALRALPEITHPHPQRVGLDNSAPLRR